MATGAQGVEGVEEGDHGEAAGGDGSSVGNLRVQEVYWASVGSPMNAVHPSALGIQTCTKSDAPHGDFHQ